MMILIISIILLFGYIEPMLSERNEYKTIGPPHTSRRKGVRFEPDKSRHPE